MNNSTKSVNDMNSTEQMRYWIDLCSEENILSRYKHLARITESDDGQTLTIVIKKDPDS